MRFLRRLWDTGRNRQPRRSRTVALVLCGGAMALAACSSSPSASPTATATQVTIALADEPPSMASWIAFQNNGAPIMYNIEEPLVTRDGQSLELKPLLATEWKQTAPTVWRFNLRQGVVFQDGEPFNAAAAAYALNYTWSEKNNFPLRQFMGSQITASAVSEFELDVSTAKPDPILPARLYFSPIFSPKGVQADEKNYLSKPVGTGPYTFSEWQRGQAVNLTKNPTWWGLKSDAGGPPPAIDNVRFTFNVDQQVRAASVAAGDADMAVFVDSTQCKPQCVTSTSVQTVFLRLDAATNPMFSDSRIRKALALGVDARSIVSQFMPSGEQASQLVGPGAVGYNAALAPYAFDPATSKALIAEAKAAGVSVDLPIQVVARSGYVQLGDQIIQVVQAQLAALGFTNVQVKVVENSQLQSQIRLKPAPADRGMMLLYQHGNQLLDLSGTLNTYFTCDGTLSAYCDKDFDAAVLSATQLAGAERKTAMEALAKTIHDRYIVIPIGRPSDFYAAGAALKWQARRDELVLVNTMRLG